jgi:hypothetical protein
MALAAPKPHLRLYTDGRVFKCDPDAPKRFRFRLYCQIVNGRVVEPIYPPFVLSVTRPV